MKNKMHNYIYILNYLINSEKFKISFFLTIILTLYGTFVLGSGTNNMIETTIIAFQFPIFNIFLFSIILFNTISICSIFSKKFDFYLIRKKTKKQAVKDIIIFCLLYNLVYFIMFYIMFISFSLIFIEKIFSSNTYLNYKIDYNIYAVFYLIRHFIIMILISIINVIIYQKFTKKLIILNIIFIVGMLIYPTTETTKSIINIIPWNYFTTSNYSSFINEVISTLLFCIILELISFVIFNLLYSVRRTK